MFTYQEVDYAEIKKRVTVHALLTSQGWHPRWSNGWIGRGECPLCNCESKHKRNFSFKGALWHCHKCERGGDIIQLWEQITGLSTWYAAIDLCAVLGMKCPFKEG